MQYSGTVVQYTTYSNELAQQYSTAAQNIVQSNTVQCSTVQYSTVQSVQQYGRKIVQYSTLAQYRVTPNQNDGPYLSSRGRLVVKLLLYRCCAQVYSVLELI